VKRFPRLDQSVTRVRIPASETAIAVEFYFVEPFLALGEFLNQQRIHGFDKANL
jgi:hypothetical protein